MGYARGGRWYSKGGRGSIVASSEDIHTHTCSYPFTVTPQSLDQPHMVRQPQTESQLYSKSHSHTVVFSQSSHHTITLAYPNSDGGTVGRVGAQGRLAPACFRFPLPVSCPSLLVLSADIDGNGSRKQTFWLRSRLTWASHIQSEKLGEVPFGW